jgi:hypothetical protein
VKLMRLSPLSQRLRRIARAHAAGETGVEEYRHARRQLLAEISRGARARLDDTHRRADIAELPLRTTVALLADVGSTHLTRPTRVGLRWLIAGLGASLAALWAVLKI